MQRASFQAFKQLYIISHSLFSNSSCSFFPDTDTVVYYMEFVAAISTRKCSVDMALRPDRLSVIIELLFISKLILRNIRSRIFRTKRSQDTFCWLYQRNTSINEFSTRGHCITFHYHVHTSSDSALR